MAEMNKSIHMGTTGISVQRTMGEIQQCLAAAGATDILIQYQNGQPIGLKFLLLIGELKAPFVLPARVDLLYAKLHQPRKRRVRNAEAIDRAQAEKTAWRLILRWLQAQLAMIDTGMVQPVEVFLPYADMGGQTLFQRMDETGFKQLPLHT